MTASIRSREDRATTYRDTVHHVTEHVSGLKTVKAMHVEDAAIERGYDLFTQIKNSGTRIQFLQQLQRRRFRPSAYFILA